MATLAISGLPPPLRLLLLLQACRACVAAAAAAAATDGLELTAAGAAGPPPPGALVSEWPNVLSGPGTWLFDHGSNFGYGLAQNGPGKGRNAIVGRAPGAMSS